MKDHELFRINSLIEKSRTNILLFIQKIDKYPVVAVENHYKAIEMNIPECDELDENEQNSQAYQKIWKVYRHIFYQ